MRSALRDLASSTIACPIERARTTSVRTSTPWSSPSSRASSSDARPARPPPAGSAPSSGKRARHAHDGDGLDLGAALPGERDRGRDHLLADVPELHRAPGCA